MPEAPKSVRLAELVATLSLGTDLGLGQPMEHVIRQCLIALRLSERLGFDESERAVVYYGGLLAWVGCHVDAFEQAKWFGDDIALKHDFRLVDKPRVGEMIASIGAGRPLFERVRTGVEFISTGMRDATVMLENHWLATDAMAGALGLSDQVRKTLQESFERWDGKNTPLGLKGEEIHLTSRLVTLADVVEVYHRSDGVEAAVDVARRRAGTQFDPTLVDVFCEEAPLLFSDLDAATGWDAVLAAEPALEATLTEDEFEEALEAIADFTDLKSPYIMGHSRGVADLAAEAGPNFGLGGPEVVTLRRAGLVHDFGRLGVSNAIWDKRSELTHPELERVRLHPYLSERMLAFSPMLAPLGTIAVQHHERMDGSGYPRGLAGDDITTSGRILAAADVYHALTELRPHRPGRTADEAASALRAEAKAGRLDGGAVDAVLRAAGHQVKRRRRGEWPAGLTNREVEVLRLLARGLSTKQIAERLVISRKTAANHVEHIYTKIGVSNRARAGLFAMKHGLMNDAEVFAEA